MNGAFLRFKVWYPVLAKAKLRAVRIHDLRHSYASMLLEGNAPMIYVKEQLGHSSINVTVDLYGHIRPGAHRESLDRLAALTDPHSVGDRPAGLDDAPAPEGPGGNSKLDYTWTSPDRDGAGPLHADTEVNGNSLTEQEETSGAPGVTRTPGTQFRKLLLYPPELRGRPANPRTCSAGRRR